MTTESEQQPTLETPAPSGGSRWVAVASVVVCGGLLALVVALASRDGDDGAKAHAAPTPRGEIGEAFSARSFDPPAQSTERILEAAGCGASDPDKPPRIVVEMEGSVVDLGKLKQGVQVSKDVPFRNDGTGPLCVARVTTGCGCLKATLVGDQKRFEPGEGGVIRLSADTAGRVGVTRKHVTITCNDPKTPLKSFEVTLNVTGGLIAEPRYLQFGNVPPDTPRTHVLHLRAEKDAPAWKVTGVKSVREIPGVEPVAYTFEVEPMEDPSWYHIKVKVTHPGMSRLGPFQDKIVVETTHPDRPQIEMTAHIHVVPRIVSRTRVITLGYVMPGAPRAPTRVRIQPGAAGLSFSITSVEVVPPDGQKAGPDGPGFEATFGRDQTGWWVDVTYDGKSRAAGLLEAQLVVHTDDELQPELRVPIRATIRER